MSHIEEAPRSRAAVFFGDPPPAPYADEATPETVTCLCRFCVNSAYLVVRGVCR